MVLNRKILLIGIPAALFLWQCMDNKISWKEEVQLQNGQVIVVKRTAKSKPFGSQGGGGWENEGMTMQIIDPKNAENPPLWEAKFVPVVFDRDPVSGQWFIVSTFYSCTSWYNLGRPTLPYTEFRLVGGVWVQGPLDKNLIGRNANMFASISSKGEPNHTLASKRAAEGPLSPSFKKIVARWDGNNC